LRQPGWRREPQVATPARSAEERIADVVAFVRNAATDLRVLVVKVAVVPFPVVTDILLDSLIALGDRGTDVTVVVRGGPAGSRAISAQINGSRAVGAQMNGSRTATGRPCMSGTWLEAGRTLEDHGVRLLIAHPRRRRIDAVLVRRGREGLETVAVCTPEVAVGPPDASLARGAPRLLTPPPTRVRRPSARLGRRLRWFNELTLEARQVRHEAPPIVPGATVEWARRRERAG
jgi:hypothetical protein